MSTVRTLFVLSILLLCAFSSNGLSHQQTNQYDQLPTDSLGKYQTQSCCPQGYNVAG